jgi:uncharacterized membrane protein
METGLSETAVINSLIELEKEDRLQFTKEAVTLSQTSRDYIFSKKAAWYWIILVLASMTATAVFIIPDNAYPVTYIRSATGIIFVLFIPGYTFIRTLFPSKLPVKTGENMDTIERVALSIGVSITFVPLVGLMLNYTPWGIRTEPIMVSLFALTIACASVAVVREFHVEKHQNHAKQDPEQLA